MNGTRKRQDPASHGQASGPGDKTAPPSEASAEGGEGSARGGAEVGKTTLQRARKRRRPFVL